MSATVLDGSTRALIEAGAAYLGGNRHEVEWLLGVLLGVGRPEVYLCETPVPANVTERFWSALKRRQRGEPLQYLLGETEFFGTPVRVKPGVFIPRPETETIVQASLEALRPLAAGRDAPLRLLDVGTGSGCISLSLARALPTCVVVGVELSWNALRVARANVARHGLSERVHLVQGCWLEAIRGLIDGIISNPPYVPSPAVDRLPLEVRQEPRASLDGGADGLTALEHLLADAGRVLRAGGILVMECGEGQVAPLLERARTTGWVEQAVSLRDLAGRSRGILAWAQ